jgi:oligoendopeptidase F
MSLPDTPVLLWSDLEQHYAQLEMRAVDPDNIYDFLLDWSELEKSVAETGTFLQLAVDLNTADSAAFERLSVFYRVIQPKVTIANAALRRKAVAVTNPKLPKEANLVLRRMQTDETVYRKENVPLEAEESELKAEYSRMTGNQVVEFEGRHLTIPEIQRLLQEPDRNARERAWRAWQQNRLQLAPELDALFLKLLSTRRQMAKNAGMRSYRELIWFKYHRYDYTPQNCYEFHDSVESEVVPFASALLDQHRKAMGIDRLQPWDFYWKAPVDPYGRHALQPFKTVEELENGIERAFIALDPELGCQFAEISRGFADLCSRPNKMSHAYCASFPKRQMPFVLENVVGTEDDVQVTLHEFGHAFHGYASMRSQPLIWNHFSATEFVEVPSQAMEVLALPLLGKTIGGFYSDSELGRVYETQISRVVHLMTWVAFMDSIQHWIYAEASDDVTIEEIDEKAAELISRFMPQTDWTTFPRELRKCWHYHHIFTAPFYYVEYALSWLGALQLWQQSLSDREKTLSNYRSSIELGDSRSVPELFHAAGAKFAFDRDTIRAMMEFLRDQMDRFCARR